MTRVYLRIGDRVDQEKISGIFAWMRENIKGDWSCIDGKYPEIGGQRHLKLNFCDPRDAVLVKLVWG